MAMVDFNSEKLSVSRQAELLSLNRPSLYYKPVYVSDEEIHLQHRIDEIYTERPVSGSRYITAILHRNGGISIGNELCAAYVPWGLQV